MLNKKTICILWLLLMVIAILPGLSFAVPAAPAIHQLKQPDGALVNARLWGDKWSNGWETVDGYSIVVDKKSGKWVYASKDNSGVLTASSRVAGKDSRPSTIKKHLRPGGAARVQSENMEASSSESASENIPPLTGTANVPVILINFSNTSTSYNASNFNTLLFGTGNKSMKDYYEEVSYGAFSVSAGPGGIAGWYTAANTHDYYGQNDAIGQDMWPGTLVREAVAAADSTFDFAPYDQDGDCYVEVIDIVHQGSGTEAGGPSTDIWSHRWNLYYAYIYGYSDGGVYTTNDPCPSGGNIKINDYVIQPETLWGNIQTVGVFAHEYGHALGLPDLYDTDGSSEGIGRWGLMASGSWNYVSRSGDTPAHMSAWSKLSLGWISPTTVTGTLTNEPIERASTASDVYRFSTVNPLEYFLVENRHRSNFDAGLPNSGLLIWHIDDAKTTNRQECSPPTNCTSTHYLVSVEQADGLWDLERDNDRGDSGDPFPGSTNNTSFTDSSTPDSKLYNGSSSNISVTSISSSAPTMTATLSTGSGDSTPPVPGTVTPSNTQYSSFVDTPFDLAADFTDNESSVASCEYCASTDGTCDTEWVSATLSGPGPTWTCSQTGVSGTNGQALTLNMRATSSGGTGLGTAIIRTVDSQPPSTSDNSSSVWTTVSPVTITLSPDDGSGSGISSTKYCIDTSDTCSPVSTGTSADVTCSAGFDCMQYVRYFSTDNVGNQESVNSSNQVRQDRKSPSDGTLSAIPGNTLVDLSWSGFSDSGSGLNSSDTYKLVYSTSALPSAGCTDGTEITSVTTQTIYSHISLVNSTTYYYRICAYDEVGNISAGATASATPQDVQYQLTTDASPAGGGSISPDCSGGCTYDGGTIVILTATENSDYSFDNWTNCDSPSNNVCTETMDEDKTVTANFLECLLPVKVVLPGFAPNYYSTLQAAYNAAYDGSTFYTRETVFTGDLNANRPISVTILGGYSCDYFSVTGITTFTGTMTISDGTVTIGDYIFEE